LGGLLGDMCHLLNHWFRFENERLRLDMMQTMFLFSTDYWNWKFEKSRLKGCRRG